MRKFRSTVMLWFVVACTANSEPPMMMDDGCAPNEFLGCADARTALRCNAAGTAEETEACAATCNEDAGRCNACEPSTSSCSFNRVETCGPDGTVVASEECAVGCAEEGAAARRRHIVPVWIPDVCDVPSPVAERTLTGTLDTRTGCDRVIQQKLPSGAITGPEICVVGARSLKVGSFLKVTGPRAIALVGDDVTIDGLLDVTADGTTNGPGAALSNGEYDTTFGGGGAGFRHPGARGGGDLLGENARAGGPARDPLTEPVFSGGTRPGDDPGFTLPDDPVPGGGGGGLLVVACTGTATVTATGNIDAGGGGGKAGRNGHGGAAGGSGGYVVIQGADVRYAGFLTVNGGGGGAACQAPILCTDGTDAFGSAGTNSGEGGTGGRYGGNAGKGDATPTPGQSHDSGITGGGGGSVGRVQVYTPVGTTPTLTPQRPFTFEPNLTINVR